MAAKTLEIKVPDDIEYRIIGDLIGVLLSSAGLLGGTMMVQTSIDYWFEDVVPLVLVVFFGYRLFRRIITYVTACQLTPMRAVPVTSQRPPAEPATSTQGKGGGGREMSPEEVVAGVMKRIDEKRAGAAGR